MKILEDIQGINLKTISMEIKQKWLLDVVEYKIDILMRKPNEG